MTTAQDIHTQIAQAEAVKRQAQQAETQRVATEQAARQKIAEADSEIARLRIQAQNLAIEERLASSQASAKAINALKPQLLAALNDRDIPAAIYIGEKISPALEALVKHNQVTLEMARNPYWERA